MTSLVNFWDLYPTNQQLAIHKDKWIRRESTFVPYSSSLLSELYNVWISFKVVDK